MKATNILQNITQKRHKPEMMSRSELVAKRNFRPGEIFGDSDMEFTGKEISEDIKIPQ
jgi:hypothetical protein